MKYLRKILMVNELLFSSIFYGQVGIGTETPQAMLDVNGDVRIQNVQYADQLDILGVDQNGFIKAFVNDQAKKLVYQSVNNFNIGFSINAVDVVIGWETTDEVLNNIITFDLSDNSFVIRESGLYNFSCFVNYRPTVKPPQNLSTTNIKSLEYSAIAAIVLQQYNKLTDVWEDFAGGTQIWEFSHVNIPRIIRLENIYKKFDKEDKFRMILRRPYKGDSEGITSSKGLYHGYDYDNEGYSASPIISVETVKISKGLDVSLIQKM